MAKNILRCFRNYVTGFEEIYQNRIFIYCSCYYCSICTDVLLQWCPINSNEDLIDFDPSRPLPLNEDATQEIYLNSVKGHLEQTFITRNFTGFSIDTLYVKEEIDLSFIGQENENPKHLSTNYLANHTHFLVKSNNHLIQNLKIMNEVKTQFDSF